MGVHWRACAIYRVRGTFWDGARMRGRERERGRCGDSGCASAGRRQEPPGGWLVGRVWGWARHGRGRGREGWSGTSETRPWTELRERGWWICKGGTSEQEKVPGGGELGVRTERTKGSPGSMQWSRCRCCRHRRSGQSRHRGRGMSGTVHGTGRRGWMSVGGSGRGAVGTTEGENEGESGRRTSCMPLPWGKSAAY